MAEKKPTPPSPDEPSKRRGRARPKSDPAPERQVESGGEAESGATPVAGPTRPKRSRSKRAVEKHDATSAALERARELALRAAESFEPGKRLQLAKQAVATSRDCAEGYLLLAEMARSRKQALAYYERAVGAAARVLGPEAFRDDEGFFWGLIETRPYMKARLGLAESLWAAGRRAEAAEHLQDMLRLNPGDNQGLRYILAGWLLNLDQLDRLDGLLTSYVEDSTTWAYTKALVAFRRGGDSPSSRRLLTAAKKANRHVPAYLLGREPLPPEQPAYYSPGDDDDAVLYVAANLAAWKSAPGAIAWVRSKIKERRPRRPKKSAGVGPSVESEDRLRRLPSEMDAWQADFRQFARRVEIAGERVKPWMILVSSRTRELVLAHALTEEAPSPEEFWDLVAGAMEKPAAGEPHRPTELQIRPGGHWDALAGHFEAIGIVCSPSSELDQVDFLFDDLSKHMAGVDPPGMLDMPGVKPEQVGRFFEAAADFYRRAPWRSLGYEAVIRIECDRYQSGPWFAVLMGQSGLTLGLALYEDLALLRRMWAGKLSDEEGARRTVALTVTFDDDATIPEADLEAIERFGWTVASPDAYPSLFRKERGLSMRPPLSWEIDLMDACLRVLPDFVARRPPDDTTRELVPVKGAALPMELGLSWIEESF
jgi:tetratricopeptide (TPR) repeat protein